MNENRTQSAEDAVIEGDSVHKAPFRDLLFDRRKRATMQPGSQFAITFGDATPFVVEAYQPHSAVEKAMKEYGYDLNRMMKDGITIRVERLPGKVTAR